jgi:two-component system sensor kinase FixL
MNGVVRNSPLQPLRRRLREALGILDAVADCIVIVDEAGTIIDMNAAAEGILGRTAAEVVGQPIAQSMPALASLLPARKMLERSLELGGLDAEIQSSTSGPIPVHIAISQSTKDGFSQYVLAVRDFRAVQQTQNRTLETERLAAIGETMTALAHESRNALQRMQSCLTLLRMRSDESEHELIDDMEDALDQLQRLYEEVRNFAAPLQLKRRKVDLHKLLDKTWRQLNVQWEHKGLTFRILRSEATDAVLKVDATRIGQVFRNVIENAIHASPDGGEVTARLEDAAPGAAALEIAIDDLGPGIPVEVRARAFDLLYTTKQGGTGMGLAIARRIVQEHRGQIAIDDVERGTSIRIVLPRQEPASSQ